MAKKRLSQKKLDEFYTQYKDKINIASHDRASISIPGWYNLHPLDQDELVRRYNAEHEWYTGTNVMFDQQECDISWEDFQKFTVEFGEFLEKHATEGWKIQTPEVEKKKYHQHGLLKNKYDYYFVAKWTLLHEKDQRHIPIIATLGKENLENLLLEEECIYPDLKREVILGNNKEDWTANLHIPNCVDSYPKPKDISKWFIKKCEAFTYGGRFDAHLDVGVGTRYDRQMKIEEEMKQNFARLKALVCLKTPEELSKLNPPITYEEMYGLYQEIKRLMKDKNPEEDAINAVEYRKKILENYSDDLDDDKLTTGTSDHLREEKYLYEEQIRLLGVQNYTVDQRAWSAALHWAKIKDGYENDDTKDDWNYDQMTDYMKERIGQVYGYDEAAFFEARCMAQQKKEQDPLCQDETLTDFELFSYL